jgi:PAS domain-containing protein
MSQSFKRMVEKLREQDQEINLQVENQTKKIRLQQKETELLNLELKKFKIAVDNASDHITILDDSFQFLYVNNTFLEDYFCKIEDVI